MLIVVNNAFGLICKPPSKFLSSCKGICSKVACNAAAESLCPPILVRGGLEAVYFIGWFLHQPLCMVVAFTISLEICSRGLLGRSQIFETFLSVFSVSSFCS